MHTIDGRHIIVDKPFMQWLASTPVTIFCSAFTDYQRRHVNLLRLKPLDKAKLISVIARNTVVANQRVRQNKDLRVIWRIGQRLKVSNHSRLKHCNKQQLITCTKLSSTECTTEHLIKTANNFPPQKERRFLCLAWLDTFCMQWQEGWYFKCSKPFWKYYDKS